MTDTKKLPLEFLETPISELVTYGITLRTVNMLERELGFIWVGQLADVTDNDILKMENVGDKMLSELKQALRSCYADVKKENKQG